METDPDTIPREELDELDRWVWDDVEAPHCKACDDYHFGPCPSQPPTDGE